MAIKHLTNDDFDSALKSGNPVLVDFWAPWCGPCKMIGPELEAAEKELSGTVDVAKVNVDDEGNLARKYRVMSIPTMILFKDGKEAERSVGYVDKAAIIKFANK